MTYINKPRSALQTKRRRLLKHTESYHSPFIKYMQSFCCVEAAKLVKLRLVPSSHLSNVCVSGFRLKPIHTSKLEMADISRTNSTRKLCSSSVWTLTSLESFESGINCGLRRQTFSKFTLLSALQVGVGERAQRVHKSVAVGAELRRRGRAVTWWYDGYHRHWLAGLLAQEVALDRALAHVPVAARRIHIRAPMDLNAGNIVRVEVRERDRPCVRPVRLTIKVLF